MWLPQTYLSLNLTIPIHAVIFAKIYSRPWQEMPTNCHIDLLRGGILFPKENGSFQEDGNSFNANVSDFSLSLSRGREGGCCLIAADPRTSWWITFFDAHSRNTRSMPRAFQKRTLTRFSDLLDIARVMRNYGITNPED